MHHKILRHLLTLFFVLILLSILGMQWMVMENTSTLNEGSKKEVFEQQNRERPLQKSQLRQNLEIRIY